MMRSRMVWSVVGVVVGLVAGRAGQPWLAQVWPPVPAPAARPPLAGRTHIDSVIDGVERELARQRASHEANEQELQENLIAATVLRGRGAAPDDAVVQRMAAAAEQVRRRIEGIDREIAGTLQLLDRLRAVRDQETDRNGADAAGDALHDARTLLLLSDPGAVVR